MALAACRWAVWQVARSSVRGEPRLRLDVSLAPRRVEPAAECALQHAEQVVVARDAEGGARGCESLCLEELARRWR